MTMPPDSLVRLWPRSEATTISCSRTAWVTDRDGFFRDTAGRGLFVHQTRMLSRYRYLINGTPPKVAAASNVEQHSWLGYYLAPKPGSDNVEAPQPASEFVIELKLSRSVGDGCHEDVDLTNYTMEPVTFRLELEVDADFADIKETTGPRKQQGKRHRRWRRGPDDSWELKFDYRAGHTYDHQGDVGTAHLHRGLTLRIARATSPPSWKSGRISFDIHLEPRAAWHACVRLFPFVDGKTLELLPDCPAGGLPRAFAEKRAHFLGGATSFSAPGCATLAPVVLSALERATHDLAALRMYDFDHGGQSWLPAAGLPIYVGLFSRDTLLTGWQAALVSTDVLRGALTELPRWTGARVDDWRDEQPGRTVHQVQDAPLSALNFNPFGRYYGTLSAPALYAEAVSALWVWTGDKGQVGPFIEPALRTLRWLDEHGDLDGDGFYEYQTRSEQGLKNQCWKDSGLALVYEDGSQVPDPIATAEMQGLAYSAKQHLADVLDWFDRKDEAKRLSREADELKKRFNERYWMEDEGYYGFALDAHKRLVRTISSDPGACLATAIVDGGRARQTADRLMAPDLFSGWGVRTLSAHNPAYNPFAYQRGSIWPVENGMLALAFMRYGLMDHVHRLCRALFEAAARFEYHRLPEVFGGQPRDADHPFPSLYPKANWPQAWSCSAVFSLVQSLLGIYPFAPLRVLVVDPHLPDWLPEITLRHLHVGGAAADIRFFRTESGTSDYEVLDVRGTLHVVRQPSPWSLTAGLGERVKDVLTSLLPGR